MTTIGIPIGEVVSRPIDVGVEANAEPQVVQAETFVDAQTQEAWAIADRFIKDSSLPEIAIVRPGEVYNDNQSEWDQVIDNTYVFLGVKPPLEEAENTQSRKWEIMGNEGESGWLSNEVRTGHIELDDNIIPFRLFDTIVVRPDGTQQRSLYVNRTGLPVIQRSINEGTDTRQLTEAA